MKGDTQAEGLRTIPLSLIELNEGQLAGLPQNPRSIKKKKFEKLKKSINDYPEMLKYRSLLVYPLDNGHYILIGGNMRFRALQELGYTEAPCIVIPKETSVDRLQAYTIQDNNEFGEWDWDLLANEWDTELLNDWGFDFPSDDIFNTDEASEDDFNEEEDKDLIVCRCKKGEIWQCGEHRVMCGDSTQSADVQRLMRGEMADLLLTDPPYNVNYEGNTKDKLKIQNDNMDAETFLTFLTNANKAADSVMRPGAAFYIWHADREVENFRHSVRNVGWSLKQCLIWNKNVLVFGRQDYQWKHEPCLYGWKEGTAHSWYSDRKQTTVLDFNKPLRNGEHPTMKPVDLFSYLINNSSKKGDNILDLFGGSGTTMIACEQLGRKCYMMELDPHYCDVILARWEKHTGKTAIKIEDPI